MTRGAYYNSTHGRDRGNPEPPLPEKRTRLLDATERIMLTDGYAAVTSRRVEAEAGLKLHYHFGTLDDCSSRCSGGVPKATSTPAGGADVAGTTPGLVAILSDPAAPPCSSS